MSKFYTRSGDDGYSGLLGEGRVPKYHPQIEAVGTIDEASAALGIARAACQVERSRSLILKTQRDLYNIMAEIAATAENAAKFRTIDANRVSWLETEIESLAESVKIPSEFIVPGDSPAGATLALARTIIRRAERRVAALLHNHEIENQDLLHYLNRLSSLCFILEMLETQNTGITSPTLAKEK